MAAASWGMIASMFRVDVSFAQAMTAVLAKYCRQAHLGYAGLERMAYSQYVKSANLKSINKDGWMEKRPSSKDWLLDKILMRIGKIGSRRVHIPETIGA